MGISNRTNDARRRPANRFAAAGTSLPARHLRTGWLGAAALAVAEAIGAVTAFLADLRADEHDGRSCGPGGRDRPAHRPANGTRDPNRRCPGAGRDGCRGRRRRALDRRARRRDPRRSGRIGFFRDQSVPKGSINLSAERGTLVLRGEVPTVEMRDRLGREAEHVDGVWSVRSLLTVAGEEQSPVAAEASARAQDGSERSARWTVSYNAPARAGRRRGRDRAAARGAGRRPPSLSDPRAARSRAPGHPCRTLRAGSRPAAGRRLARRRPRAPDGPAGCGRGARRSSSTRRARAGARTCRSISTAGRRQSIQPSARVNGRTSVASRSACGSTSIGPPAQRSSSGGTTSTLRSASAVSARASSPDRWWNRPARDDGPGVQLGRHHRRVAALPIAGEDGSGDRCGAPVARQQRRMR